MLREINQLCRIYKRVEIDELRCTYTQLTKAV